MKHELSDRKATQIGLECLAVRARMVGRNISRHYDQALRPVGLKTTQFTLLVAIKSAHPESIVGLAQGLAMERTTLTRNLQIMEKQGLVELGGEGYRRCRSMHLTEKGEELLKEAFPLWQGVQNRIKDKLGEKNWETVKKALETLTHF